LKNISVGSAMTHSGTGFLGFGIFTRLPNKGSKLLAIGTGAERNPLPKRIVFVD
jgi:hypothetical protein